MVTMMEMNQIRYVLKTAKCRNFSHAAIELFVSQPTLSQQLSKLEQELGVILFERTTRSVKLTSAGEDFVAQAQKIVDAWDELNFVMQSHATLEKGRIVIGVLPTIGQLNLTHYIADFLKNYSGIKIEMVEDWSEELMVKLLSHEIDLAFLNPILSHGETALNQIECHPLVEDTIMLVTNQNNGLSEKSSVTMEELSNMPVLMLKGHTSMTKTMYAEFKRHHINPPVVCECVSTDTLVSMIIDGMGISFLTRKVATKYKNTEIRIIPIYPPIKTYTALVLAASKHHTPITLALKEFILQQFEKEKKELEVSIL